MDKARYGPQRSEISCSGRVTTLCQTFKSNAFSNPTVELSIGKVFSVSGVFHKRVAKLDTEYLWRRSWWRPYNSDFLAFDLFCTCLLFEYILCKYVYLVLFPVVLFGIQVQSRTADAILWFKFSFDNNSLETNCDLWPSDELIIKADGRNGALEWLWIDMWLGSALLKKPLIGYF